MTFSQSLMHSWCALLVSVCCTLGLHMARLHRRCHIHVALGGTPPGHSAERQLQVTVTASQLWGKPHNLPPLDLRSSLAGLTSREFGDCSMRSEFSVSSPKIRGAMDVDCGLSPPPSFF